MVKRTLSVFIALVFTCVLQTPAQAAEHTEIFLTDKRASAEKGQCVLKRLDNEEVFVMKCGQEDMQLLQQPLAAYVTYTASGDGKHEVVRVNDSGLSINTAYGVYMPDGDCGSFRSVDRAHRVYYLPAQAEELADLAGEYFEFTYAYAADGAEYLHRATHLPVINSYDERLRYLAGESSPGRCAFERDGVLELVCDFDLQDAIARYTEPVQISYVEHENFARLTGCLDLEYADEYGEGQEHDGSLEYVLLSYKGYNDRSGLCRFVDEEGEKHSVRCTDAQAELFKAASGRLIYIIYNKESKELVSLEVMDD